MRTCTPPFFVEFETFNSVISPSLVEGYTFLSDGRWSRTRPSFIPFNERVVFVSLLNCAEFSSRFSEVAKALDTISGIEFLAGSGGSERGGFLARSASGVAPGYDKGGCGALGSSRIWLISLVSFRRAAGYAAPFVVISYLLDLYHRL
jgi:hypothetical protein